MSDTAPTPEERELQNTQLQKAVIVALRPGQPPRVLAEAMRYATLLSAPLLIVHVDVTRFVTFEDPDGMVHSAPIDLNIDTGAEEFAELRAEVEKVLAGSGLTWTARQLVGDPALAIKHLAGEVDAQLIVVGTRSRGIGESIREFFTGSVAARLSHRQSRPILVVPLEEPVPDTQKEIWPE
ncbi:universal stress protein [Microbacterium azadirachtae]|jgi:nucleotide-binding universal stress UspA family protein|uniref:Nucleotide-binding universal stress protein, UspA family n=1 Tax=Microbacterium azadirachtae TaxID=582680 RepID=A0A0F0L2E6_9MICO|nr:universal stress protein [Microbacterium azadirachtae]KJL27312.1 Universal stress protein family protein [Microbacterium azadirachtae]UXW86270.1 universal stress protein [Microbacterium azadirachtae]SDL57975.1 Nucleotide-binding universal stress protein, UspA family [Microbacterium azadirachtae]SEF86865.1 Nucleotide-binding universal stress protein, UspA family [Microbacterium azadirachtae]SEF88700.1 Nucleotide-binding universal stress protein, UspA family [Microbacterium azadirachtae]